MTEIIQFPSERKLDAAIRSRPESANRLQAALDRREQAAGLNIPLTVTFSGDASRRIRMQAALFSKAPEKFVQDTLFGIAGGSAA